MKKKHIKLAIIFFIFFKTSYFVHANENTIIPKKKPTISNNQVSKKITNIIIPLKKPNLKIEEIKTKKIKINNEIRLKEMIDFERNRQLNQFSTIYYNKIKINYSIDEK